MVTLWHKLRQFRQSSRCSQFPSLRTALILPLALQTVLAVSITGGLSHRHSQRAVNAVAEQWRLETGQHIARRLDLFFAAPQTINRINGNAIALGSLDFAAPDGRDRFYSQFAQELIHFPQVDSIFYGTIEGEFIGAACLDRMQDNPSPRPDANPDANPAVQPNPTPNGTPASTGLPPSCQQPIRMEAGTRTGGTLHFYATTWPTTPVLPGTTRLAPQPSQTAPLNITPNFDPRQRPWYRNATTSARPSWGEIFVYQAYPVLALPAVMPIYDQQGNLKGVLGNNFFLSQISDFLQTLAADRQGQAWILDRSGQIIASSTPIQPYQLRDNQPQLLPLAEVDNALGQAIAQLIEKQDWNYQTLAETVQLSFRWQRERHFVQVMPFADPYGLDWLIVIEVPERAFMAEVEASARTTLLLCGLAVGVSLLGGLVASRGVLRSLQRLTVAARALAQGDLKQRVPLSLFQELRTLGQSFNDMAQQLQQSFAALQQSNQALADRNRELNSTKASLEHRETLFRLLAENTQDLICLHDREGLYLYVSPSVRPLLGYSPTQFLKHHPLEWVHPRDRDPFQDYLQEALNQGVTGAFTYRVQRSNGDYLWVETLTRPILDEAGQVMQLQSTSRNVTATVRMQRQLEHDAFHDSLTGLPNRNLLLERLYSALRRIKSQPDYQFAILFLDLDRFKIVNDSLGHLAGDELLMEIGHRLKHILRRSDLAARLGGDEFIILVDEIPDFSIVLQQVESIFELFALPFTLAHQEVVISVSIGVVVADRAYQQATELLRDADIALYRAKARGRACVEVFNRAMHQEACQRLELENNLRTALARKELLVYYQPIVSLKRGNLKGFEALVRWQHPTQGMIPPDRFIAIAEETGLIIPLGQWVLRSVCEQLKIWHDRYPNSQSLTVSVNLSALQLRDPSFLGQLDALLEETQVAGRNLVLELTESLLINNMEETIALLQGLHDRHIGVSIDDFGTGYSCLSYLHRLPLTNLKIDKSFVAPMLTHTPNRDIVSTIITLAQHLNLQTIAEGVETPEQLTDLYALGCDCAQGYLFNPPLTVAQVEDYLLLGSIPPGLPTLAASTSSSQTSDLNSSPPDTLV